jgi:hypothetical protein
VPSEDLGQQRALAAEGIDGACHRSAAPRGRLGTSRCGEATWAAETVQSCERQHRPSAGRCPAFYAWDRCEAVDRGGTMQPTRSTTVPSRRDPAVSMARPTVRGTASDGLALIAGRRARPNRSQPECHAERGATDERPKPEWCDPLGGSRRDCRVLSARSTADLTYSPLRPARRTTWTSRRAGARRGRRRSSRRADAREDQHGRQNAESMTTA